MRKKFEQQLSLDVIPISSVKIPDYKRDELPPTLKALQYIFTNQELNQEVFSILEEAILSGKKKTGRIGMDLWHILVLGVVRMTLDINYDRLWDITNHHKLVRQIMGIESTNGFEDEKKIPYNTIRENVRLLDESTIAKINEIVVKAGHQLVKKKEEKLTIKADTYVLETNVHFPTNISLLWDSSRKCLDIVTELRKYYPIKGWRKLKFWYKDIKKQCRILSKACQSGGKNKEQQVKKQATEYLRLANELNEKINQSKEQFYKMVNSPMSLAQLLSLDYYQAMLRKHINLTERRLIKGEVIPQSEKLYSIFETHTEWKKKGKKNKEEQEEEKSKVFKKLRNKHSAVESNINSLEHHGLNRCPDKGKRGFVKYTALGVLSCNLHRLELIVMSKQAEKILPIKKAA